MVGKHATPTKGRTNDQSSGLSTESVVASNGLLMRAGNVRSGRRIAVVASVGLLMHAGSVRSCRRIAFGSWPLSMVGTKTANEGCYSECRIGTVGLRATPCEGAFNLAMSRKDIGHFGQSSTGSIRECRGLQRPSKTSELH